MEATDIPARTDCSRHCSRTAITTAIAVVAFVCLSPPLRATQSPPPPTPPQPALLSGTVLDEASAQPLSGAILEMFLVGDGDALVARVEANRWGVFSFPALPPGPYALHVERAGYLELLDTLELVAGADWSADVRLAPEAIDLEPVVVSVQRRGWQGSFDRRRAMGVGSFVTREEIAAGHFARVTEIFRRVPGVRVIPDGLGQAQLLLRGGCRPAYYIDGVSAFNGVSLDLALRPNDVEAIEVYTASSVPARYGANACGVVLLWTRVPQRTREGTSWTRGLAVAGALFALVVITR